MRIGAHVSTAGGASAAIDRAVKLGVKDIQIFPWSPRIWGPVTYAPDDIERFKAKREAAPINTVIFHNVYLINLAGDGFAKKSQTSFQATVKLAEEMDVTATVVHLGHHAEHDIGLGNVVRSVYNVTKYLDKSEIWLETTAGTRNAIGASMRDLGRILKGVSSKRVHVLIDTCHIWAAGYDIRSKKGFDAAMEEIEREIGFPRVKGFHLNDAKGELGEGKDRHENIGLGYLGKEPFRRIVNLPEFAEIAGYLETPRVGEGDIERDIATLRKLGGK